MSLIASLGRRLRESSSALGAALYRTRRTFALLGLLAFTVLAAIGLRRMKGEVEHFPDIQVYPRAFRPVRVPTWADDSLVRSLRETSAELPPFSILDADLRASLDRHWRRNPWVREITRVDKEFPNKLTVTARIRRPIAYVELPDKSAPDGVAWFPVDSSCVRLPGETTTPPKPGATPIPLVQGTGAATVPAAGRVWDDEGVRDGVAIALELFDLYNSPIYDRLKIAAIDVRNTGGRIDRKASEIVLATDAGKLILWGRSRRTKAFGEISTADKLAHLTRILDAYPSLAGVEKAKVYFEQPYVVLEDASGGTRVGQAAKHDDTDVALTIDNGKAPR
ncbi:MAG: hypothetical protein HYR85_02945 [Planctomycetes bacterium]|nr:hypothetical protein [Planctomycetota bacterium]